MSHNLSMPHGASHSRTEPHSDHDSAFHGMHCMEIWGDYHPADRFIQTPGLDLHVISRPLDGAGGDVHYVSLCGGGLITRILLADVSGHGVSVSERAGELRKLMRRFINTKSQIGMVSRLNNQIEAWSSGGLFATSLVATYLASTRRLTLCNAGHPRALLYRSRVRAWMLLDAARTGEHGIANLPLGVLKDTPYTQVTLELDEGDRLILYTDMLIETRDSDGHALGEEGVLRTVQDIPIDSASVAAILLQRILSDGAVDSPADDVTLIELKHNGRGTRPPGILEKPAVYGKVFGLIRV